VAKSFLPLVVEMEKKVWCRLLPDLVLFRLVVPPLQPGVVGPFLVRGIGLPSHVSLEGTVPYTDLLGHNRWPTVSGL
jgi:hypothetical protein